MEGSGGDSSRMAHPWVQAFKRKCKQITQHTVTLAAKERSVFFFLPPAKRLDLSERKQGRAGAVPCYKYGLCKPKPGKNTPYT